ncbi:MAG: hypothetical protein KGZ87_02445 [Bacteroidetes bacterium]|nr:hypothetical protein [Bacteroidota bacterium]
MKKLVLSMLLVMMAFTMNANTIANQLSINNDLLLEDNPVSCYEAADSAASALGYIYGLSYEQEYEVFAFLYDDCMANNP